MSRVHLPLRALPSVLDRLLDDDPANPAEAGCSLSQRQAMETVRRDLEWLLNTRRTRPDPPEGSELCVSAINFGLGEFPERAEDVADQVRLAIERYEPRLRDVQVQVLPGGSAQERVLHLLIQGELRIEPFVDQVAFDTRIEPASGQCQVEAS
jgi:type VI secretion system protein ImpF